MNAPKIEMLNEDCMEVMRRYPDKHFDLAIVDPPYGLGERLTDGGGNHLKFKNFADIQEWDVAPGPEYFAELFRVTKNQIIWGGNYFNLGPCRGFAIWDKQQSVPNFSACEFAWTSFDCPSRLFRYRQAGFMGEAKINPTQKPVPLYEWLLRTYAQQGWSVLDTHGGSMTHAHACFNLGFDLVITEKRKVQFDVSLAWYRDHVTRKNELADIGYAKTHIEKTGPTLFS